MKLLNKEYRKKNYNTSSLSSSEGIYLTQIGNDDSKVSNTCAASRL